MTRLGKRWERTVAFRDLLSNDGSDENSVRVGKEIAKRVSVAIPENNPLMDDDLQEIIERFEDVRDCDELNDCLSDLYDWGDYGKRLFVEVWKEDTEQ